MAQALLDSVLKSAKDSYETETGSIETDWPIADAEEYKIWSELRAVLAQSDDAYGYLSRLFKTCAPQCEPLPDLMGLCTQIDNLIAGLRQDTPAPTKCRNPDCEDGLVPANKFYDGGMIEMEPCTDCTSNEVKP